MTIPNIINFLTTEDFSLNKERDFYVCVLNVNNKNTISVHGFTPLEAICNCYTKWKNIELSLSRGTQNLSQ